MLDEFDIHNLIQLEKTAKRFEFTSKMLRHAVATCRSEQSMKGLDEMVAYAFNAQQHAPQYGTGGGGLPAGPNGENVKYKVVIASSETKPTKDGQGGYLAFELRCIEGPFNGQTQVDRLNLYNQSPQAVQIANQQLSAYCHVIGIFQLQDTQQLHEKPFIVEIGKQKGDSGYTEVKKLYDVNGNEPGKAGSGPQVQQQAQPAPNSPPPGFGPQGGQPQGGGWQQQPQQQQPAQGPSQGGWGNPPNAGGSAPAGGGQPWGGAPQGGQQPAQGGGWQQNQQPQQQAPQGGGWQQNGPAQGGQGGPAWGRH